MFEASHWVGEILSKEADSLVHSVQVNKHKNMFNKYEKKNFKRKLENYNYNLSQVLFICVPDHRYVYVLLVECSSQKGFHSFCIERKDFLFDLHLEFYLGLPPARSPAYCCWHRSCLWVCCPSTDRARRAASVYASGGGLPGWRDSWTSSHIPGSGTPYARSWSTDAAPDQRRHRTPVE